MKLRNKKTGEIVDLIEGFIVDTRCGEKKMIKPVAISNNVYTSLAELNEEWEDAPEEPKLWWYIDITLVVKQGELFLSKHVEQFKAVGNYFETREEAELAVHKLKAWKRLKDDGLKIRKYELNGGTDRNGCFTGDICLTLDISKPVYEDILQLLFGGEE